MTTFNKAMQTEITPEQALDLLAQGNERFVQNTSLNRNFLQQMEQTKDGQQPFAVILSCIDSRASSEIIFDLGIGDAFSIRVAGNVINQDILGSMEFGCKAAGAKLLLVLGHTQCGAIKGACDYVEMGNLTGLLDKISPSVDTVSVHHDNKTSTNAELVFEVTKQNVMASMEDIKTNSALLRDMIEAGDIKMVGGMHDIATGIVTFF